MTLPLTERIKSRMVLTPLEKPLIALRQLRLRWQYRKSAELNRLYCEQPAATALLLTELVNKSDNAIDVGAHLGIFLSFISRKASGGRHTAFEPIPAKAERLTHRFPEVRVHQKAVGQTAETVTFYVADGRTAASGLHQRAWHGGTHSSLQVAQARLDDTIAHGQRVNVLKVDVEGNELNVFRGAARILQDQRPLILFESVHRSHAGTIHALLTGEHGYCLFAPMGLLQGEPPLTAQEFDDGHRWPFVTHDYFAVPSERLPQVREGAGRVSTGH